MVRTNGKDAPVAKAKATKPDSPKKKKQAPNMRKTLKDKKENTGHTIRVLGFHDPLYIEVYQYTKPGAKPGFINNFRLWSRGEIENDSLTDANFIGVKNMRDQTLEGNENLLDDGGYARQWIPPDNVSTVETRTEGLRVLKAFLMSKEGSDYPATTIDTVDTATDVPEVLEKSFLDDDIQEIIKATFDFEELNDSFYEKFTSLAKTIYMEKEPSDYAKTILGFPSLTPE